MAKYYCVTFLVLSVVCSITSLARAAYDNETCRSQVTEYVKLNGGDTRTLKCSDPKLPWTRFPPWGPVYWWKDCGLLQASDPEPGLRIEAQGDLVIQDANLQTQGTYLCCTHDGQLRAMYRVTCKNSCEPPVTFAGFILLLILFLLALAVCLLLGVRMCYTDKMCGGDVEASRSPPVPSAPAMCSDDYHSTHSRDSVGMDVQCASSEEHHEDRGGGDEEAGIPEFSEFARPSDLTKGVGPRPVPVAAAGDPVVCNLVRRRKP